ncbi:hypothetical protein LINPERPRIM_LOCUS32202 [Linum perenne]
MATKSIHQLVMLAIVFMAVALLIEVSAAEHDHDHDHDHMEPQSPSPSMVVGQPGSSSPSSATCSPYVLLTATLFGCSTLAFFPFGFR